MVVRLSPSGPNITADVPGELRYQDITDDQSSGNFVSYAPTGFGPNTVGIRLTPSGPIVIRGMPLANGQQIVLRCGRSSSFPIILMPEDATADDAQKFNLPNGFPFWIPRGGAALIRNDESRNNVASLGAANPAIVGRNLSTTTINAATTDILVGGTTLIFPANSLVIGAIYRFSAYFDFVHTAAATPVLQVGFGVNGVPTYQSLTPASTAATFSGKIEGYARFTGPNWRINHAIMNPSGLTITDQIGGFTNLPAVDATVQNTLDFRIRMATAVASNSLLVYNGCIEQLVP